ncbi:hypothetical protein [Streptomyces sp. NPDC000961]|uniref:hypothetical protein n=1 Tax=Streptomyces sp. NPDC000961 TaxID=3364541 RepID=UPI00368BA6C7
MATKVPAEYLDVWVDGPVTDFPWHLWTDGSTWQVREGEDFNVPASAFIAAANIHANLLGLTVKAAKIPWQVGVGGQIILFRFEKRDEDDE